MPADRPIERPIAAVAHVITQLELGGAQQNTLYTCEHLDRARFEVHLAYGPGGMLDGDAAVIPRLSLHPQPRLVRPIEPATDLLACADLTRVFLGIRRRTGLPLIVHTHSSKAGIVGRTAARAAGAAAVVHSIHGFGFDAARTPLGQGVLLAAERMASVLTDRFVAVAQDNIDEGVRRGLFAPDQAEVIRSGIPLHHFALPADVAAVARREVRAELGIPEEAPVAAMIGNFKPQKAPVDFVDVCAAVLKAVPDAQFFFAGDGELRYEVERRIEHHGLMGRLRLLGWRRDVPRLLAALDVLVLTSRWEGLPRVYPQAMAAGRAIAGTDVNGGREAVVDGENGYLCRAGDIACIARHTAELLRDARLRAKFAAAGRKRVAEWDIDEMVRAQERLYVRLLREKGFATR